MAKRRFYDSGMEGRREEEFAGFPAGAFYQPYRTLKGAAVEGDYCDTVDQTDRIFEESVDRIERHEYRVKERY